MARNFISNMVGFSTASDLAKLGKGYTLNMYVETLDANEHSSTRILRPFPGYKKVDGGVAGKPRGLYRVSRGFDGKPKVYGVWGGTLYLLNATGQLVKIGDVRDGDNAVNFCETGGEGDVHPHLIVVDGVNVYAVDTALPPSTQALDYRALRKPLRTNSDEATITPSHCAYAYGYLVVNDSGTDAMYFSYQYPFETLDAKGGVEYDVFRCVPGSSQYISEHGWVEYSEWQPDNTVALIGNGSRIFTFGERSYQIFSYNASGSTPFVSPDTAAEMIGIKAADTLSAFGNLCVWLGASDMGESQVFSLDKGGELKRISTPEIERRIAKFTQTTAFAYMYQYGQHVFYILTFPDDDVTLCYDFREDGWVDLGSLTERKTIGKFRYRYARMNQYGDIVLQGDNELVRITDEKWLEHDDTPIVRKRRGGIVQVNHNRFFVDSIKFLTNNGEYGNLEGKDCIVSLRYSGDGATFNDEETYSCGSVGQYDYDVEFFNLGLANYLTMELSCSENVPFALYGMTADLRECK